MSALRAVRAALLLALAATAAGGCARCGSGEGSAPAPESDSRLAPLVLGSAPGGVTQVDVDFDGKVHLVGWSVDPRRPKYPPGTEVKVTLVWRCDQALGGGWQLFTHLVAQDGRKLAVVDDAGPLRKLDGIQGQPLPPGRWEPGKLYRDELTIRIPDDPSAYVTVGAGIYKGTERLPIRGAGGDRERRTTIVRLGTGERDTRTTIKELVSLARKSAEPIVVDGRLDEPAWEIAGNTGPFVDVASGRDATGAPTGGNARLTWDDDAMYVGIEAKDATVHGGWPAGAKDPHLWEKDTVELMIDPDGDGDNKDYYEIQINPQNLVFDTQYDDYNSPNGGGKGPFGHEEWSARLTSTVVVHGTIDDDSDKDRGYTVEAKIPWSSFGKAKQAPPRSGDTWRMNFYAMQDNGGVAWSPILGQGNFHRAARFGRVRWVVPGADKAAPSASASAGAPPASASAAAAPSGAPSVHRAPRP